MQATQMLVIIMPTIVADIGGAAYYTWAAMLYTIGSPGARETVSPRPPVTATLRQATSSALRRVI
jgi:hypothetical protein